ncbi:MAG: valine--tRNA ligase [Maricaulaceae bacterium]|jgi:valyl-tRNA synthetase
MPEPALEKTFDPKAAEPRLYEAWEQSGAFKPQGEGEAFAIVIPPPNVTGSLHIGHALNNTLQDVLVRFHRMRGERVLWQPGTDHAGIATQMVVERQLMERQEPSRRDLGREEFVKRVWAWKEESGGIILNQLRRLGASCDWSRERFTMDEGLSAAVRKVFVELYEQGLIYRAKRLVNWDPHFQTAISDLEVENKEVQGHMWHFKYPLEGGQTYTYVEKDGDGNVVLEEERDYISIATTRPETMLGDGAVAVHPSDERYAPIVGKLCEIPVGPKEHRRLIPIIVDDYPDPEFGSGAVKITGAHDLNDYGVAERNNIPKYRLMDEQATMRADGAPYAEAATRAQEIARGAETDEAEVDSLNLVPDEYRGLDRFEARKRVVADIDAEGLMIQVEDKSIMQPFGDRSAVVIEPMLTDQWFVDAKTLAKPAIEAVRSGKTTFHPENWAKTYFHWMENIEPWCISRQLWWGHRIPAWYGLERSDAEKMLAVVERAKRGEPPPKSTGKKKPIKPLQVFCAASEEDALKQARAYYDGLADVVVRERGEGRRVPAATDAGELIIFQDPDVLDTWFSSGLWPFSTLGWPEETDELKTFYPTSVLVTAHDIIFFWVARMMMQGLHFMHEVPFKDVYIHALVRDEKGQKMSKSKGNVIDPLELIEEYGADAMRFTLAALAAQGRDIRMSKDRVEGYRNFGTKIWNAARFAQMNGCKPDAGFDPRKAKLMVNRWIVGEVAAAAQAVTEGLEAYKFDQAAGAAYRFAWNTYCDWYLELIKPVLSGADGADKDETRACAAWALDELLKLLHPFMPFVTEELWTQTAGDAGRDSMLITAAWPAPPAGFADEEARAEIGWLVDLISEIRSVRADMNVPPAAKAPLAVSGASKETQARLKAHEEPLMRLARLESWTLADAPPKGAVQAVLGEATYALPLGDLIDLGAEKTRLAKEIAKADGEIVRLQKKLGNEKFVANAPEEVVAAEREKQSSYEAQKAKLAAALERLEEM